MPDTGQSRVCKKGRALMVSTEQQLYETASQEDRSAHRIRISIPASLRPSGSKGYQTVVRDLSLSGFSAMAINPVHPGTRCWLTMPGLESMEAKVIWWEDGQLGCAFDNLLSLPVLESILERWRDNGFYTPDA